MKKTLKKLTLNAESVRNLGIRETARVRGGAPRSNDFCPDPTAESCFTWDLPAACDTQFDCEPSAFPCPSVVTCELPGCNG